MTDVTKTVQSHYHRDDLAAAIRNAIIASGRALDDLRPEDLAPVDEFHVRGRESTVELARLAAPARDARVLDIGCGIGGTARYLAVEHGATVTGVDLTPSFVATANELSSLVGLSDRTRFEQASALDLPFHERTFDLCWTEHVQMNVGDKRAFYAEAARVLVSGGKLAFHDIFAGPAGAPYYPAPWADTADTSQLCAPDEARAILEEIGLEPLAFEDVTERSVAWFDALLEKKRREGPSPLGLHLVISGDPARKLENVVRGMRERRLVTVMGVFRKR